ncbi:MAG TPA: tetratricopeptide repeat protein, partial [Casimicrobiaceae bacterium]
MSHTNDEARLQRGRRPGPLTMREDYARWFTRGRAHQKAGHLIEAMICYERTLQSNAHAVRARFRMGEVLRELGRDADARAAWHAGLNLKPAHLPMRLALADAARRTGEYDEAIAAYRGVLAAKPGHPEATLGLALSRLVQGNEAGYAEVAELLDAKTTPWFWDELARALAVARPSPARTSLLLEIASTQVEAMPALMLACAAEEMIATGETERTREMLVRAESQASLLDDLETLRRLALVAARAGSSFAWAECYAQRCVALFGGGLSLLWPRRTAGTALRVIYLVAPGTRLTIDGVAIDVDTYLRAIVATHARERIVATVCVVGEAPVSAVSALLPPEVQTATLGPVPDAALARSLAEADADALVDLVGLGAAIGPLLAQRPARTLWTYPGLAGANVAPLVTHALPSPSGDDAEALAAHRTALELALMDTCTAAGWFADVAPRTAFELGATWRAAVKAHQSGDFDGALSAYQDVLAEQPTYAPGQYLLGTLLRDRGRRAEAGRALAAAVESAPTYVDARVALADLLREEQLLRRAAGICEEGLRHAPNEVSLWRVLGLVRLAQREGAAARKAFRRAIMLAPTHAMTHYNEGVALQMLRNGKL